MPKQKPSEGDTIDGTESVVAVVPEVPAVVEPELPQTITLEIVSWRDVLPCGDRTLAMGEKLATITLEPGVNVGWLARALNDSLCGQPLA